MEKVEENAFFQEQEVKKRRNRSLIKAMPRILGRGCLIGIQSILARFEKDPLQSELYFDRYEWAKVKHVLTLVDSTRAFEDYLLLDRYCGRLKVLHGILPPHRLRFYRICKLEEIEPGKQLYEDGGDVDSFYGLLSGKMNVFFNVIHRSREKTFLARKESILRDLREVDLHDTMTCHLEDNSIRYRIQELKAYDSIGVESMTKAEGHHRRTYETTEETVCVRIDKDDFLEWFEVVEAGNLQSITDSLKTMAILETKSLEELIQIARKVEKVNILPNQPIRMESNAIDSVYLIDSGEIRVLSTVPFYGKEHVIELARLQRGQLFGEHEIINGFKTAQYSYVAGSFRCTLLRFNKSSFFKDICNTEETRTFLLAQCELNYTLKSKEDFQHDIQSSKKWSTTQSSIVRETASNASRTARSRRNLKSETLRDSTYTTPMQRIPRNECMKKKTGRKVISSKPSWMQWAIDTAGSDELDDIKEETLNKVKSNITWNRVSRIMCNVPLGQRLKSNAGRRKTSVDVSDNVENWF